MIYIQVLDRYWAPGSIKLRDLGDDITQAFEEYMAQEFVRLFRSSIDDQRYKNRWRDLTPGYLQYKKAHGLSTNTWEATSQVKNDLKVLHRGRKVIVVGYDRRFNHIGTHTKVFQIAKWMEYGNLRIPPRPLFRYIYRYMSANVDFFWKRFLLGGYF